MAGWSGRRTSATIHTKGASKQELPSFVIGTHVTTGHKQHVYDERGRRERDGRREEEEEAYEGIGKRGMRRVPEEEGEEEGSADYGRAMVSREGREGVKMAAGEGERERKAARRL